MSWSPCSLTTNALIGNPPGVQWLWRCFHCRGHGFDPWWGNSPEKKKKKVINVLIQPSQEKKLRLTFIFFPYTLCSFLLSSSSSSLPPCLSPFLPLPLSSLFFPLNQVILQEEKAQVSILLPLVACSAFCFPNHVQVASRVQLSASTSVFTPPSSSWASVSSKMKAMI